MLKIAYHTVGCRLNQVETIGTIASFHSLDIKEVPFNTIADIYIINSCTVTESSHNKSLKAVRQAITLNPKSIVVAAGCAVSYNPESFLNIPGISLIVGAQNKEDIFQEVFKRIEQDKKGKIKEKRVTIHERTTIPAYPFVEKKYPKRTRAYLKIQDGCHLSCAFCVVTVVRGNAVSYKKEDIIAQTQKLIDLNYKEIVLTGVNLGSFSFDNKIKAVAFDDERKSEIQTLLEELLKLGGDVRFRLSSINPEDINKKLIDFMDTEKRICKHLHISIQSGSDTILRQMKRPYKKKRIIEIFNHFQKSRNSFGIGSDILLGFPGETEEDFRETYRFIEENPFTYLHVFPFSARKKTKADSMEGKVKESVIQKRVKELKKLAEKKKENYLKSFIGKKLEVIFETKKEGKLTGTSSNYLKVKSSSKDVQVNSLATVHINALEKGCLIAH
ncbi:MAG: tRNA (N(6)-L-threonylcarbamoyladenosine(37)-C(2))-methylthiotransferase MtaB [Nitrospinae bacterium]|nr:tRNA (N(6)-L-threonylcarbamoyladenosine(37)-C(2))-methylthiotransferase MtaB [Nitrospinota bacterium]